METSCLTPDIVVVRAEDSRAVFVRGRQFATAIDLPSRREELAEMLEAAAVAGTQDLKLAILTHEPANGQELSLDGLPVDRVIRRDRKQSPQWHWDVVPSKVRQKQGAPVHLVRGERTVYDDAGRAFHCLPVAGPEPALAVHIEPENVLVVAEDLHADLPPAVVPGSVLETIARYESWLASAPAAIVPASGVPLTGETATDALRRSVDYLRGLQSRMKSQMLGARLPWERMVHTIHWGELWPHGPTSGTLVQRHKYNIREMAADIWLTLHPEAGIASLSA